MRRLQPREIVRRVHVDLAFGERQQLNFFEMLLDDLFRTAGTP